MGLINPLLVKNFSGASSVTLTPPSGKSLRVVDIVFYSLDTNVTVQISKSYVGFIAGGNTVRLTTSDNLQMSQFDEAQMVGENRTLMKALQEAGLAFTYPVAQGEEFSLTPASGTISGYLVYQLFDGGDVKNTEVNGSASDHYIFLNYGRPSASITPPGYADVNYTIDPNPFPNFPFGEPVLAGVKILIHGFLINPWGYNSYAGSADHTAKLSKIKVLENTKVLFDPDMAGIKVQSPAPDTGSENVKCGLGGSIAPYMYVNESRKIGLFSKPLEFDEGTIVYIQAYVDSITNGDSIPLTIPYVAVIEEVSKK